MKTEPEIKERLKEAKAAYNSSRKSLRAARNTNDYHEYRVMVINQMYELAIEIDVLEWMLQK